ncbi:MAG: hypothetical protein H7235_06285 [Bdellovibrionaceae bacterium]|nr:hypothetical protein [Pseudobdellovibrionaceae bacterium]
MKLKLALVFFLLFIASVFVVFYLKDYFFIQTNVDHTKKQSMSSQFVIDVINDQSIKLYDYQSKPLDREMIYKLTHEVEVTKVFHFWASWCDPCALELPELISYAKKLNQGKPSSSASNDPTGHSEATNGLSEKTVTTAAIVSGQKVQIYLVSLDSDVEGLNKFSKIFSEILSNHFVQVWDKENTLTHRFGVDKLPMTIFIFPDGKMELREGVVNWKNLSL